MTIVIVKGATFGYFEKNVPDQVPLTSVADCWPEETVEEISTPAPIINKKNGSTILNKVLLVMATLHYKKKFYHY